MAVAVALCVTGLLLSGSGALAGETQPNIVVFYMDDVAPHDGRLWNDPDRTPAIYHHFVEHGVQFTNAIGESPLCCPGRASLLTGLHTHNNGVYRNDARLFNPDVHVGTALQAAGYETIWLGKYLNIAEDLTEPEWQRINGGWSHLEVPHLYTDQVRTRDGWVTYPGQHPTKTIGDRAVQLIHDADPDQPIFAVVAPFNLHSPNIPMPVPQEQLDKCVGMPPWNPPNFNEADVSDKPAYMQAKPLLTATDGWPMQRYCEEMFGIDSVVEKVTDELAAAGRLDDTLLVFTADNGMTWGSHRIGQWKSTPYATPVPLYMSWPSRWGNAPRTITEHVSIIDLAPTFCAFASCILGPYSTGQAAPDGISIAALLDGSATDLGRDAVLETLGSPNITAPAWSAVRTTELNELGLWHFVRYSTGELELYDLDLAADPYELENLADEPEQAEVVNALSERLDELLQVGRVNRPDASVQAPGSKVIMGYNVFDGAATARQTAEITGALKRHTYKFKVRIDNNTVTPTTLVVRAHESGSTKLKITYAVNGIDVTAAVNGAGYTIPSLPNGTTRILMIRVAVGRRAPLGATRQSVLNIASQAQPSRVDVVAAVVSR